MTAFAGSRGRKILSFLLERSGSTLRINAGFILDGAGNITMTMYSDLREAGSRNSIPALVKGCKQEHAQELQKAKESPGF